MASDLPRVRVHDDGAVALHMTERPKVNDLEWFICAPEARRTRWEDHQGVSGPGWRDAAIVPLPGLAASIADAIRPTMLFGLADADLEGPGGDQRIDEWVAWLADTVAELVRRQAEEVTTDG